jgi:3-hydroxyisobutyrate dehydrogenase
MQIGLQQRKLDLTHWLMSNNITVAFLGLGVMGGPMAGHLAAMGYRVIAYNRTAKRAQTWLAKQRKAGRKVEVALSPQSAAKKADIVLACVGNDDDLAEVVFGKKGALAAMRKGALFIDHTTVSAKMARRINGEARKLGVMALDAPVSGGQAGAENGQLAIMCGGTKKAMAAAGDVLKCYGKTVIHVGPAGSGQTAKMANQMCIAGVLGGLSEAIRLAQAAGLDMDKTYEAISGGAAQSWQMDNRWDTMTQDKFNFGFAVDWMRKDLGYALDEARELGLSSPVSSLVDQFYADIQAAGGGRMDTSSLIGRLPKGKVQ